MYDLRTGCILADESALGKKVQVIGYMAQLASSQTAVWGPHLVVTATGCLPAWTSEFERWFPSSKTCVYYGVPYSKCGHERSQVSSFTRLTALDLYCCYYYSPSGDVPEGQLKLMINDEEKGINTLMAIDPGSSPR